MLLCLWVCGFVGLWGCGVRPKSGKKGMQTGSKIDANICPKSPKIFQTSIGNRPKSTKICPKSIPKSIKIDKNAVWGGFGGSWGAGSAQGVLPDTSGGCPVYHFDALWPKMGAQRADFGTPGNPKGVPKSLFLTRRSSPLLKMFCRKDNFEK